VRPSQPRGWRIPKQAETAPRGKLETRNERKLEARKQKLEKGEEKRERQTRNQKLETRSQRKEKSCFEL
jgi:hypothetical protein